MPHIDDCDFPAPLPGMESVHEPYLKKRRFDDWLNPPTMCDVCGSDVKLVDNTEIYSRQFGKWPYAYFCQDPDCAAYVGLHPHSLFPLGRMADKPTRDARQQLHALIDPWWDGDEQKRTEVYRNLAELLRIPMERCHVSHFDYGTCQQALRLAAASPMNLGATQTVFDF